MPSIVSSPCRTDAPRRLTRATVFALACACVQLALGWATTTSAHAHAGHVHGAVPLGPPPPAGFWDGAAAARDQLGQASFDRSVELAPDEVDGECVETAPVDGVGPACKTDDGLLRVPMPDGSDLMTHGPDFAAAAFDLDPSATAPYIAAAVQTATKADVACVPTSEAHVQVIYATPVDGQDRSSATIPALRQSVYEASAVIDARSRSLGDHTASRRLRVACNGTNDVDVDVLRVQHTKSQLIAGGMFLLRNDIQVLRGDTPADPIRYLVFYDADMGTFAGLGSYYDDSVAGAGNSNNANLAIALQDNTENIGPRWSLLLHETTHNMGAVMTGATEANDVGHCNDGLDVMCYAEPGTPGVQGTYDAAVCPELEYDCNADTYFNPAPPGGSWLANNWNVASTANRFLEPATVAADTTPPAQVTNVAGVGHGEFIRLTWDAVADSDVHAYRVERDQGGSSWVTVADSYPGDTTLDAHWTGIAADTDYTLRVRAFDTHGNLGTPSTSVVVNTGPSTGEDITIGGPGFADPTDVVVTAASTDAVNDSVTIAWTGTEQSVDYYDIEWWNGAAWTYVTYVSAPTTTATVTGLPAAATQLLRVRANDSNWRYSPGNASAQVTAAVGTVAPAAPASVSLVTSSGAVPTVTWPAATGATGYRITTSPATTTRYVTGTTTDVPGLTPGTTYTIQVASLANSGAASTDVAVGFSAPAQGDVTRPAEVSPVNALTCTGSVTTTSVATSYGTSGWSDDVGVVSYRVLAAPTARPWEYHASPLTPVATTTATVSGLTPATTYTTYVVAYDAAGNNRQSSYTCSKTTVADNTPPNPPGSLAATATSATSIDLGWPAATDAAPNVSGIASYRVYRTAPGPETLLATVASPTTAFTVTGLSEASAYTFAVEAVDLAGNASIRRTASATTLDVTAPTALQNLAAPTADGSSITLTWDASTDNVGVAGYRIHSGTIGGAVLGSTATTSFTVSGLTEATSYTFAIEPYDVAGNDGTGATITASTTDVTAPGAPAAPTFGSITGSGFPASWTDPGDNVAVTAYRVELAGTPQGWQASTNFNATGLAEFTTYAVRVQARDAAGNESAWSPTANVKTLDVTAPSAPGSVAATEDDTTAYLSWAASTDNDAVAGYNVYANAAPTTPIATLAATARGYAATVGSASTAYDFFVTAFDAAGNESSASAHATGTTDATTDTTPPTTPGTPGASAITTTGFTLDWTAATDDTIVDHYLLTIGSAPAVTVTGTSHVAAGLDFDTSYAISLVAVDAAGNTGPAATSAVATAQTPDTTPPSTPAGPLSASATTSGVVALRWGASVDDRGVVSYTVHRNTGAGWFQVASTTGLSANLAGQPVGSTVQYAIIAYDAAGNASGSLTASVAIPAPPQPPPPPGPAAPAAPANVTAAASSTRITVSWNAVIGATQGYRVSVTRSGSVVGTATTTSTSITLGRYVPKTSIHVDVVALGDSLESAASGIDAATTADTRRPTRPLITRTRALTRGRLQVRWRASRDDWAIARYEIWLRAPRTRARIVRVRAHRTVATISRLRTGTRYIVRIRAVDRAGNRSAWHTRRATTRRAVKRHRSHVIHRRTHR